jgi:hypothetical protein
MAKGKGKGKGKGTRKPNTPRKLTRPKEGAPRVSASLAKERATAERLRRELRSARRALREKKKPNPRRPPRDWWRLCLASVEARRYARDAAAVCGAAWWRKPPRERARIVRAYERGTPAQRRIAYAIARAEQNRAGKALRGTGGRKANPPPKRTLLELVYIEKKPGDSEEVEYEHRFSGHRPTLRMRGGRLQIDGGSYKTRDGWIYG